MFERNRTDNVDRGTVAIRVTLDDGRELQGKFVIPAGRSVFDVLNGTGGFIELETFDGERSYVAKQTLRTVQLIGAPKAIDLAQRARESDGFDPHAILGVAPGQAWDEVRQRYLELAKIYHPDRYAMAELPREVTAYLAAMARRVNLAFAALEAARAAVRPQAPALTAVYTSRPGR